MVNPTLIDASVRGVLGFAILAASWDAVGFFGQVAATDPSSIASVFDLMVEKGLSLSLAILLIFGSFTQRISFDGRDERQRMASREKDIDEKLARLEAMIDKLPERINRPS